MKLLILILAFLSSSAFAQNHWFNVSKKDAKGQFFVNLQSLEINEYGNPMAIVKLQAEKISFNFVAISKKDCVNGYGNLFWYDMNKKVDSTSEYVYQGGTNSTNIADILCDFLKRQPSV